MRHEFGFCSGPCAGFVSEWEYRRKVETAAAFLEGRTIQPIDRVVTAMQEAADRRAVRGGGALAGEVRAARMAAGRDQPGQDGGGPAHLRVSRPRGLRRRSGLPGAPGTGARHSLHPTTPIEREAFRALVAEELARPAPPPAPLPPDGDRRDPAADGVVPSPSRCPAPDCTARELELAETAARALPALKRYLRWIDKAEDRPPVRTPRSGAPSVRDCKWPSDNGF